MKNAVLMLVLALALVGLTGEALAQTASISVTVELAAEVSIAITTQATWPVGSIALDDVVSMSSPSVVTNQGNVSVDLAIDVDYGGADANGWTAAASTSDDVFTVDVDGVTNPLTTSPQTLATGVATSGTQNVDATYTAPSGDTIGGGEAHDFAIVVAATEAL